MIVHFESGVAVNSARAAIKAKFGGIWYPWPLGGQGDVCKNLVAGKCPLVAHDKGSYAMNLFIPSIAPVDSRVVVQLRLTNQQSKVITCVRINVLVK